MKYSAKTKKAIKSVIKRWTGIQNGSVNLFKTNCDLCLVFNSQEFPCRDSEGNKCPILEKTGCRGCINTPYKKIWNLLDFSEEFGKPNTEDKKEFKTLTTEMLDLLKSIPIED